MHSITHLSANRIKQINKLQQKKYRQESQLFIVEGLKALEELVNANIEIVEVFALKTIDTSNLNIPVTIIEENIMKKISTTSSVCEILTLAKQKTYKISDINQKNKLILLDSISDPGNLGTIIRSASAFGIDGIILYGNCTELYSSKVIRSAAGNFFKIPVIEIKDENELKNNFKEYKFIATALSKENNISLKDCAKLDKSIIMFGSEASGLNNKLINLSNSNIRLEMANNVESINLAVCASIIIYELSKIHRS